MKAFADSGSSLVLAISVQRMREGIGNTVPRKPKQSLDNMPEHDRRDLFDSYPTDRYSLILSPAPKCILQRDFLLSSSHRWSGLLRLKAVEGQASLS
jgi:hypothetical protein